MYSIQGLWTAVKYNIPVTYVVFNNASYRILKMGMVRYIGSSERKSDFMGMNFGEPAIDISKQAAVWGMHSRRIDNAADIPRLREKLAQGCADVRNADSEVEKLRDLVSYLSRVTDRLSEIRRR